VKGYGFIRRDDGGDVFVHQRSVERAGLAQLQVGQRLSFDVVPSKNSGKPQAWNIELL
jgi:cold shock protein